MFRCSGPERSPGRQSDFDLVNERFGLTVHVNAREINLAEIGFGLRSPFPFSPINWRPRTRRIRAIWVESELRLTARESRSRGSGASLDAPEGSMLPKTLLPGAWRRKLR